MPTRWKRPGSGPSWARLYSAGSSLRRARSPVAPNITSVVGATGRRSSPAVSGFSGALATAPPGRLVAGALTSAPPSPRSFLPRRGLDGVPAELVAQRRQHAVGELAVAARAQARVERGGDHGRGDVVRGGVRDRPAPLARVLGVALDRFQVVALGFERARGQFAQPRANHRPLAPQM